MTVAQPETSTLTDIELTLMLGAIGSDHCQCPNDHDGEGLADDSPCPRRPEFLVEFGRGYPHDPGCDCIRGSLRLCSDCAEQMMDAYVAGYVECSFL